MTVQPRAYRRDELHQKLAEVQSRLEELRYIDNATEYLEAEQARWWHNQPLGDRITVEVPFGETVPFTRSYQIGLPTARWPWEELPWHSTKESEVRDQLRLLADEAGTWAAESIAALIKRINQLTHPSAAMYEQGAIAPLEEANWVLENLVSTDFDRLGYSIAHWEGEAAADYVTNFHDPFKDMRDSQSRLLGALAGGLVTAKVIVESTQQSLMNVADQVSTMLHEQLTLRSLATVRDSTGSALILGAGVASIAGAIAGTALWAAGWEAVAAGLSLASTTIPSEAALPVELFGSNAEQLLESFEIAIGDIENGMIDQYELLDEKLVTVLERVAVLREQHDGEDGRLVPIRPSIVDGVDADSFYLPDVG